MVSRCNTYRFFLKVSVVLSVIGCTEEFVPKTETFDNLLVIEANITDELKHQEILLSRTFRFETDSSLAESNANVKVVDNMQNEYNFEEIESGRYVSDIPFQVVPNQSYFLSVETADNTSYVSSEVSLKGSAQIENLYAERFVNDGVEGIGIFIDSFDPNGTALFYRYEFETTFRFEAPNFNNFDLVVVDVDGEPTVQTVPRPIEKKICYKTDPSRGIYTIRTEDFAESRVERFLLKFIPATDYSISDRYSIIVRQFVQSREAQVFYETLNEFSNSETLFSQVQPGFIRGNIRNVDDPDDNVLGLFQVSSVSSERMFFNYRDFFPDEDLPPFFEECPTGTPRSGLIQILLTGLYLFNGFVEGELLVVTVCGDCTVIGNSEVPEFWED